MGLTSLGVNSFLGHVEMDERHFAAWDIVDEVRPLNEFVNESFQFSLR